MNTSLPSNTLNNSCIYNNCTNTVTSNYTGISVTNTISTAGNSNYYTYPSTYYPVTQQLPQTWYTGGFPYLGPTTINNGFYVTSGMAFSSFKDLKLPLPKKSFKKYENCSGTINGFDVKINVKKEKWENIKIIEEKSSSGDSLIRVELSKTINAFQYNITLSNKEVIIGELSILNWTGMKFTCAPFLPWLYSLGAKKLAPELMLQLINYLQAQKIDISDVENAPSLLKKAMLFI